MRNYICLSPTGHPNTPEVMVQLRQLWSWSRSSLTTGCLLKPTNKPKNNATFLKVRASTQNRCFFHSNQVQRAEPLLPPHEIKVEPRSSIMSSCFLFSCNRVTPCPAYWIGRLIIAYTLLLYSKKVNKLRKHST